MIRQALDRGMNFLDNCWDYNSGRSEIVMGKALRDGFRAPPPVAKPRVWWHWMNGNVTKDGIRRDLDWMKRMGIGGVDAIDASIDTPQVVKKRLVYMTPEWKDAFRYAAAITKRHGMELSIDSSPGWSGFGRSRSVIPNRSRPGAPSGERRATAGGLRATARGRDAGADATARPRGSGGSRRRRDAAPHP